MEQVTRTNLPIVGRIQHGEQQVVNQRKRVTELGYFIAKTKNNNMNFLLNRFNEKYPKQTFLNVQFFDEDPLTVRKARYNQGGIVCYCMSGTSKGKQKVSNKWQDIECDSNCKYCIKQEGTSKPACNYEGTLKFMLPEISQDRIWIMKITGQQSISNLEEYIEFQKYLGNSLKGTYTIFLNQIEQTNSEGKKFNNFVIDIVKAEDFNSNNNSNSQIDSKNPIISTQNIDDTIPSQVQNEKNTQKDTKKPNRQTKTSTKKDAKTNNTNVVTSTSDGKNDSQMKQTQVTDEKKNNAPETHQEHCFLYDTEYKNFKKSGKDTEYLIAKVADVNDKTTDVVVKPEFREKIEKCDIGTELIIELEKFGENIISKHIEFVNPIPKKVAA
jgi:hypothetical protein